MITTKLNRKHPTTIQKPVRAAFPREGDELADTIIPNRVLLTLAQPEDAADNTFTTFSEWVTPSNTSAYVCLPKFRIY